MKELSHLPKTDIRFWQKAVFCQPYTVDGQRRLTKEWYARTVRSLRYETIRERDRFAARARALAGRFLRGCFCLARTESSQR
jgi:hypothetical protein